MWRNYFTIAFRSLASNRLFAALNIGGLAVGMAACLLIALWVRHETTYDQWLPDADRIFAMQGKTQYPGGKPVETWSGSSVMLLPPLKQDYPQIEAGTRMLRSDRTVRLGERIESQPVLLVDKEFFEVFKLPLVSGNWAGAFSAPDQVVVSEKFAQKWFGATPAQGQTLLMTIRGEKRPYRIGAVMRDLPSNSVLAFDMLVPYAEADLGNPEQTLQWGNFSGVTFVKLKSAADAKALTDGADAFIAKHQPDFLKVENGFYYRPLPKAITEVHLQSPSVGGYFRPPGDPRLVTVMSFTGLLILVIAGITYVNLATARVSLRAREVGLRKTLGAERGQLMTQFLVESSVLAALAGVLALAIVEITLPAFNGLLAQRLALSYSTDLALPLLAMVASVGVLGGWYPALVLARLRPREAINGLQGPSGGGRLRQLLVISQFTVAVLLMICMAIVYMQVAHLRKADMGYQPEGMLLVTQIQRKEVLPLQEGLVEAFSRLPGVVGVTRTMFDPTGQGAWRVQAFVSGVPEAQAPQLSVQAVDWNFLPTYGGRLLAGRDLSREFGNDSVSMETPLPELRARGVNVLINRSALKIFDLREPSAVLGKTFSINVGGPGERLPLTVVGVVDDIRLRSARDQVEPAYFMRNVNFMTSIAVRYKGVPPAELTAGVSKVWKERLPDTPFRSQSVDSIISKYYEVEMRRGNLFALFAGIAIVLCAVGLYGLAVFTALRRTKEIGIRKVLGASVPAIVRLLLWEFSRPVLVSIAIAAPLAWWVMRDWLQTFDVRIALTPWPFLLAGVLALLIAGLTVAWHAVRVAGMSPIHALRYE